MRITLSKTDKTISITIDREYFNLLKERLNLGDNRLRMIVNHNQSTNKLVVEFHKTIGALMDDKHANCIALTRPAEKFPSVKRFNLIAYATKTTIGSHQRDNYTKYVDNEFFGNILMFDLDEIRNNTGVVIKKTQSDVVMEQKQLPATIVTKKIEEAVASANLILSVGKSEYTFSLPAEELLKYAIELSHKGYAVQE